MIDKLAAPDAGARLHLDLRQIAPALRQRLIFRAFDGLVIGGTLEITSDEDPRPLCTELDRRCAGAYTAVLGDRADTFWMVQLVKNDRCVDSERDRPS